MIKALRDSLLIAVKGSTSMHRWVSEGIIWNVFFLCLHRLQAAHFGAFVVAPPVSKFQFKTSLDRENLLI